MKTIKIHIATLLGGREVDAYAHGAWATHRSVPDNGHWTVTHLQSGRRVGYECDFAAAYGIARALDEEVGDPYTSEIPRAGNVEVTEEHRNAMGRIKAVVLRVAGVAL